MRRSTLTCDTARELISLRLDGETSEICSALLRRHLSGCPGCREFAAASDAFTSILRSQPFQVPSRSLVMVPRPRRRSLSRGLTAVGSVAAAGFLAFAVGSGLGGAATQTQKLFRSDQEQQAFVRHHLRTEPSVVSPDQPVVISHSPREV